MHCARVGHFILQARSQCHNLKRYHSESQNFTT